MASLAMHVDLTYCFLEMLRSTFADLKLPLAFLLLILQLESLVAMPWALDRPHHEVLGVGTTVETVGGAWLKLHFTLADDSSAAHGPLSG